MFIACRTCPGQVYHNCSRIKECKAGVGKMCHWVKGTDRRRRGIVEYFLDLLQNFGRQLRDDLKRLEVVDHLLRRRSTQNYCGSVGVLRNPCERQACRISL